MRQKISERMKKNNPMHNSEVAKRQSESMKALGNKHPLRQFEYCKAQSKRMSRDSNPAKRPEVRKKISESGKGRKPWNKGKKRPEMSGPNHPFYKDKFPEETRKSQIQWMRNGGAAHANSFIQNPSKPQVELFKKVQKIYPQAKLNYSSLNRSIDIAIPDLMIAIEYDGSYWHQDEKEDKTRQQELETIGWKFLRYEDYVPKTDKLKKDLRWL